MPVSPVSRMCTAFTLLLAVTLIGVSPAAAWQTKLVSENINGTAGDNRSNFPSISGNGRYIAFQSTAEDLVPFPTAYGEDVFLHDLVTSETILINTDSQGVPGNNQANRPSVSLDGRWVAFASSASNLVPGDTNNTTDIFVYERETGQVELVSLRSDGVQLDGSSTNPSISQDGRYIAFSGYVSNALPGTPMGRTWRDYIYDRSAGTLELLNWRYDGTPGNGVDTWPSISGDGMVVAFTSGDSFLVPNDANGTARDIFVRDLQTATTELVSMSSGGVQANDISVYHAVSDDGRFVVFQSDADNLVANDTNGTSDIFLRDRLLGTTERVSLSTSGEQGNGYSTFPDITPDGRIVVFQSDSTNFDPSGRGGIFLRDLQTGTTEKVDLDENGAPMFWGGNVPAVDAVGRFITFFSGYPILQVYARNRTPDLDGDGFEFGDDCNDDDPLINPGAVEIPYNGIDENCSGMGDDDDLDGDSYLLAQDCNDGDASIYPWAPEVKFDGIDQDCNGYDLTIVILTADYSSKNDTLDVEATSSLGASADLVLEEYGAMSWERNKDKWAITVRNAGGNPGSVTVSGIEGWETASTGGLEPEGKGMTCSDEIDNDGDELVDCADPDCAKNRSCR